MRKYTAYKIVVGEERLEKADTAIASVVRQVEAEIADGWQPQGGICVTFEGKIRVAYQGMIKADDSN